MECRRTQAVLSSVANACYVFIALAMRGVQVTLHNVSLYTMCGRLLYAAHICSSMLLTVVVSFFLLMVVMTTMPSPLCLRVLLLRPYTLHRHVEKACMIGSDCTCVCVCLYLCVSKLACVTAQV